MTIGRTVAGAPVIFGTLGDEREIDAVRTAIMAEAIPCVLSPERTARVAIALLRDAGAQHRLAATRNELSSAAERLTGPFDEAEAKSLLARYGITIPQGRTCKSRAEAHEFLRTNGGPVAVKILSHQIAHKTEVGGVILNVATVEQMDEALDRIDAIPVVGVRRYLIERLAAPGIEMIVGGIRDRTFGPLVLLGFGGTQAEALKDSATRLAPLDTRDVDEMLGELRAKSLLEGFRNFPPVNKKRLAEVVKIVARIMIEHPEILEIEINPLRISIGSEVALDALIST